MKKNTVYLLVAALFMLITGIIIYRYQSGKTIGSKKVYALLPRKGAAATTTEWSMVKKQAFKLQEALETNASDGKLLTQLAALYIREARITGNYTYYDKAALTCVDNALAVDTANYEALVLKSLLYLSQHHFADGLALAEKAKSINPHNAFVYGIAVDGNVEMGNYTAAVADADKMLSIRPDLRSYSRAAYLREIYGDYPGAITAMKMAIDAGAPGDEATEWCRIQLARLYENTGDLESAGEQYAFSNTARPGYAYALAGLGKIAAAQKDYAKAIKYLQQADTSVTDFSIKELLADTYKEMGSFKESDALRKEILTAMDNEAVAATKDPAAGHYSDKELAYAYLEVKDYDKALRHAKIEYNRRPDNIDVNECIAWVYYNKEDYTAAERHIKAALKTNCKNPALLCRAGLIYAKAAEYETAKLLLQEALRSTTGLTGKLKTAGVNALQSL